MHGFMSILGTIGLGNDFREDSSIGSRVSNSYGIYIWVFEQGLYDDRLIVD